MLSKQVSKSKRVREILNQDSVWMINLAEGVVILNEKNDQGKMVRCHQFPSDGDPFCLNDHFQSLNGIRNCEDIMAMCSARHPPILLLTEEEALNHFKLIAEENGFYDENDEPDYFRALDIARSRQAGYGEIGSGLEDLTDAEGNIVGLDRKEEEEEKEVKKKSLLDRNSVNENVITLMRRCSDMVDKKERKTTKYVQRKLGYMELSDQDWLFVFLHAPDSTLRSYAKNFLTDIYHYNHRELTKLLKEEKGLVVEID